MVLIEVEDKMRCEAANVVCTPPFTVCAEDPSDEDIGLVCSMSNVSLYFFWLGFAVSAGVFSVIAKWAYNKYVVPSHLKQIDILNKHFKKKLYEAQNNNLQLRFQENSVKLIFQLFNVVQFMTVLFYTEIVTDITNGLFTVTISLFMTPLISFIINYSRPDIETLSAFLRRNLDVDEVSDEDLFETAYLIEVDKKNKVSTDVWFPWKRSFLIYIFGLSLFAMLLPWATFAYNEKFLSKEINQTVFYVSTILGCFLNVMIVLYWYIGRRGMAIFKNVNGELELTYNYGSLAQYFSMAGYTATIYIDPTGESAQRKAEEGAGEDADDAFKKFTLTRADELGEGYGMSPRAEYGEVDEGSVRAMRKVGRGRRQNRRSRRPGDLNMRDLAKTHG